MARRAPAARRGGCNGCNGRNRRNGRRGRTGSAVLGRLGARVAGAVRARQRHGREPGGDHLRATNGNLSRNGGYATDGKGLGAGLCSQGALEGASRSRRRPSEHDRLCVAYLGHCGVVQWSAAFDPGGWPMQPAVDSN